MARTILQNVDYQSIDTSSGNQSLTLEPIIGKQYMVRNFGTGSNTVTVTYGGSTSSVLNNATAIFVFDGTNWSLFSQVTEGQDVSFGTVNATSVITTAFREELYSQVFTSSGTFTPLSNRTCRVVADTTGGTFNVTIGNGVFDGQKVTCLCDEDGTANANFIINGQSIPFSPGRKLDLQWNAAESKWDFEDVVVSFFSTPSFNVSQKSLGGIALSGKSFTTTFSSEISKNETINLPISLVDTNYFASASIYSGFPSVVTPQVWGINQQESQIVIIIVSDGRQTVTGQISFSAYIDGRYY